MNKIYHCLLLLSFMAVSCTAEDLDLPPMEYTPTPYQDLSAIGDYHILVIGNSLSRDACSYVPLIMKDLCPNVFIDFNIYYKSTIGLSSHWNSIYQNRKDHILDYFNNAANKWEMLQNIDGKEIIKSKNWDLVILQESTAKSIDYEDTSKNANRIAKYIRSTLPECKIAYMLVPARPDGVSALGELTSDEYWQTIANVSSKVAEDEYIDFIIPCGTAIQNARHTYLDNLGNFGHLSYDGTHLQEGLPCFIDAYTVSESLFHIFGINSTIGKSGLRISKGWVYNKEIPGRHGGTIVGNEEDYKLCQQCALAAFTQPFTITILGQY